MTDVMTVGGPNAPLPGPRGVVGRIDWAPDYGATRVVIYPDRIDIFRSNPIKEKPAYFPGRGAWIGTSGMPQRTAG